MLQIEYRTVSYLWLTDDDANTIAHIIIKLGYLLHTAGVYGRNICYGDGRHPRAAGRAAVLLQEEAHQEAVAAATAAAEQGGWESYFFFTHQR